MISRRQLLLGAVSAVVLGACGSRSSGTSTAATGTDESLRFLVPFFATGEAGEPMLRSGLEQRMPWGIADHEGVPLQRDLLPERLAFDIGLDGSAVATEEVARFGDGTPQGYFPLRYAFEQPGTYSVRTTVDDQQLERWVVVATPDEVDLVQPGERAIPVVTPTPADAQGVDPICTREPTCPFHDQTLADALANGKPTAFLIATPQFCQTSVCGPVLELLIEEAAGDDSINAVHAEVYENPNDVETILDASLSEATKAYRLPFEPSLLLVDGSGMVVDRLDFVYDREELRQGLELLRSGSSD